MFSHIYLQMMIFFVGVRLVIFFPPVLFVWVFLIVFCCCFIRLHPLSCVLYVFSVSVSGLSILDCPIRFSLTCIYPPLLSYLHANYPTPLADYFVVILNCNNSSESKKRFICCFFLPCTCQWYLTLKTAAILLLGK